MILQAKQFGVTITTSLDLYECYNHRIGSDYSLSESNTNIYTNIDKQEMTHAIYNIMFYAIRSSAAGSQGNGNININTSFRQGNSNVNDKSSESCDANTSNDGYVIYEVSYTKHESDPVSQLLV